MFAKSDGVNVDLTYDIQSFTDISEYCCFCQWLSLVLSVDVIVCGCRFLSVDVVVFVIAVIAFVSGYHWCYLWLSLVLSVAVIDVVSGCNWCYLWLSLVLSVAVVVVCGCHCFCHSCNSFCEWLSLVLSVSITGVVCGCP